MCCVVLVQGPKNPYRSDSGEDQGRVRNAHTGYVAVPLCGGNVTYFILVVLL
jgi:hypothetical protein